MTNIAHPPACPARAKGFTLIEVLAAVALLALGVLSLGVLQQQVLQRNFAALHESQAWFLLQDIAERMRASGGGSAYLLAYAAPAPTPTQNCLSQICNAESLARWDLAAWRAQVEELPEAQGQVSSAGAGFYTVAIRYGAAQRELSLRFEP
ncbi:MAG: type IV pilus modification protein PilV [Pseudomonadales bacterium]|jgi:type IV pilus assembly protein PilV|nr:type IV pilus modification protein PilV [Pseudomonadales bacterium]